MANVLIVDDDLDVAEATRALLEMKGHQIRIAETGKDGMVSLSRAPLPDCVLLDVDMPVLNGPAMAHQMLLADAGREKIPILLVSGRLDLAEVAARMGTPYFLAKGRADYGKELSVILGRALNERLAPTSA